MPHVELTRRTGPGLEGLDTRLEHPRTRDERVPGTALTVGPRGEHRRGLCMESLEEQRVAKELVVAHERKISGGAHDGILGNVLGGIARSPGIAARTAVQWDARVVE